MNSPIPIIEYLRTSRNFLDTIFSTIDDISKKMPDPCYSNELKKINMGLM